VFGLLITIAMMSRSMMSIGRSMVVGWLVMVDRGRFVVFGFRFVSGFRFVGGCGFRFVSGSRSRLVGGGSGVGVVRRRGGVLVMSTTMIVPVFLSVSGDFDKAASVG